MLIIRGILDQENVENICQLTTKRNSKPENAENRFRTFLDNGPGLWLIIRGILDQANGGNMSFDFQWAF